MTPTQARLWTLKEIIDWAIEEQGKCEETQDHWTIIGNATEPAISTDMPLMHYFPIGTKVNLTGQIRINGTLIECEDEEGKSYWVSKQHLENRKHLNTDRYNALQSVIDKCNELKTTELKQTTNHE